MKDIKVFDISQDNFNSFDDITKEEKVYSKVLRGSNGSYGVYELTQNSNGTDFKIFCSDDEKKVIGIEYTINDAVVVHNDVAELYWNVLGNEFEEKINDFKVMVHLPGEDDDVRIWTHGPVTGKNRIIDSETLYFEDTNVKSYTPETIRIMFNKELVPKATKMSNVDGKKYILKYESSVADETNKEREDYRLNLENNANEAILKLEKYNTIFYYNRALKLVNQLDDESDVKEDFLLRIEKTKDAVNSNWKNTLKEKVDYLTNDNYKKLYRDDLEEFKAKILEGFDVDIQTEYIKIYKELEEVLVKNEAEIRKKSITYFIIVNSIFVIIILYRFSKIIIERYTYKGHYYRDFPTDDNPNVLEYLMKGDSTSTGLSATILDLINKKIITYEKDDSNEDNFILVLKDPSYTGTMAEKEVLKLLFEKVGKDRRCSINEFKNYGNTIHKANLLVNSVHKFEKETIKEANKKDYFKKNNTFSILMDVYVIIVLLIDIAISVGIFYELKDCGVQVIIYTISIMIAFFIYFVLKNLDGNRTSIGKEAYSKWLAHKRFLKHFSNFKDRDLPDIVLWDKYLVTATVLGCADKVEKRMRIYINNNTETNSNLLICKNINYHLTTNITSAVKKSFDSSNSYILSASTPSSYSSGGGFGGGSSFGRWRPEAGGGGGRF